jgi:hypothetical protein
MKLEFKNVNPCVLLDKLNNNEIKNVTVTHNGKAGEKIAECVWVECKEDNEKIIKEIVKNLDNTENTKVLSTEEKLVKEIATLKINDMKKDTVISNLTKTIAELKIKVMNVEEGK